MKEERNSKKESKARLGIIVSSPTSDKGGANVTPGLDSGKSSAERKEAAQEPSGIRGSRPI